MELGFYKGMRFLQPKELLCLFCRIGSVHTFSFNFFLFPFSFYSHRLPYIHVIFVCKSLQIPLGLLKNRVSILIV